MIIGIMYPQWHKIRKHLKIYKVKKNKLFMKEFRLENYVIITMIKVISKKKIFLYHMNKVVCKLEYILKRIQTVIDIY